MPLCRLSRWCTRNRQANTAPWVHGKLLCRLDSLKINDLGILQLPDCGKLLMENNYQKLNYSFQWGLCTCFSNLTMIFVYIYQIGRLTNENWEQALAKSKLSCEGRRRWSREGKARADAARRLFWCFPSLSVFRYLGTEKFVKSTLIPSTGIIKKIVTDWSLLFPTGWTDIFIT